MPQETGAESLYGLRNQAPEHMRHLPVIGISASAGYTPPEIRRAFTAWFQQTDRL
jgi:hypothetical protein